MLLVAARVSRLGARPIIKHMYKSEKAPPPPTLSSKHRSVPAQIDLNTRTGYATLTTQGTSIQTQHP